MSSVLLLGAGIRSGDTLVGRALGIRPLQHFGDLSYSWYLWHFPILILGGTAFGTDRWWVTVGLVVASYVAALISFKYVETPLRALPVLTAKQIRSLGMGAALVAVASCAAIAVPQLGQDPARTVEGLNGERITLRPAPEDASSDYISMRTAGCDLGFEEVDMPECAFADVGSDKQVVLLGDSHAVVMFPPLEKAANQLGWQVNNWTKSGCTVADVTLWAPSRERAFTECDEFREMILDRVVEERPDAVVISFATRSNRRVVGDDGDRLDGATSRDQSIAGLRSVLTRLTDEGIPVLLVVDNPIAPFAPPTCLAEEAAVEPCTFRARGSSQEVAAAEGIEGVTLLRPSERICKGRQCSPCGATSSSIATPTI
ncbi:acyltransferase family protein [Nocardioides alcanivorans]|uniref:acyltransferase family protein n=1 Tax=Nocardioides alcanivorans TaxID=2897352 RepID=UPI001F32E2AF|nr:acyltransferase family protein [Nocardioides alcanivorans]